MPLLDQTPNGKALLGNVAHNLKDYEINTLSTIIICSASIQRLFCLLRFITPLYMFLFY